MGVVLGVVQRAVEAQAHKPRGRAGTRNSLMRIAVASQSFRAAAAAGHAALRRHMCKQAARLWSHICNTLAGVMPPLQAWHILLHGRLLCAPYLHTLQEQLQPFSSRAGWRARGKVLAYAREKPWASTYKGVGYIKLLRRVLAGVEREGMHGCGEPGKARKRECGERASRRCARCWCWRAAAARRMPTRQNHASCERNSTLLRKRSHLQGLLLPVGTAAPKTPPFLVAQPNRRSTAQRRQNAAASRSDSNTLPCGKTAT